MKRNRLALVVTLGLMGLILALSWFLAGQTALAQPPELTVCPAGSPTCDFDVIQDAVDAAGEGYLVKIAAGTYSDVEGRPVPPGYLNPPPGGVITQVVYLSKTLTLQGGYTTTNWSEPDPGANPTTLDAQGLGRVLVIAGTISPTIEGLCITGGDATELGGYTGSNWPPFDTGGGICVIGATATISNNQIFGNTAGANGSGGGLYLLDDTCGLKNNTVTTNTANTLYGGGMYTLYSDATLTDNTFSGNTAGWGGAVFLEFSPALLTGNDFVGNACAMAGGALNVHTSDATITGNLLSANTATQGGGAARLYDSAALVSGNVISGNIATGYGGGLHLWSSPSTLAGNVIVDNSANTSTGGAVEFWFSDATFVNNWIVDNRAADVGTAMYVLASDPRLVHNTIADNVNTGAGDGSAIYVDNYQTSYSSVWLTNTILFSHTVGIHVAVDNAIDLEATLWGNDVEWTGPGTIFTGSVNLWGDPAFVDPEVGNYHIGPASLALDAGVDAGVDRDIDGDPRPLGVGYDIGADESVLYPELAVTKRAYPGQVQAGGQLTYTLRVTNTGTLSLTATITDVLPGHVTPGGILTWTPPPLLPDGVWTERVAITVESDYAGPLTNVVYVASEEGAKGVYTHTVTVAESHVFVYLPLVIKSY